jgi:hypothetical protein
LWSFENRTRQPCAFPPDFAPVPQSGSFGAGERAALALTLAKLRVARSKLLDEDGVYPYLDTLLIDSLRFIPSAHLG